MSQPTNNNSGSGKDLDDLFRDTIGQQEFPPSPKVWRNLNWRLLVRELIHFNFINIPKLALVSATGGLVILASLTYWVLQPGGVHAISTQPETPAASVIQPSIQQSSIAQPAEKPVSVSEKLSVRPLTSAKPVPSASIHPEHGLSSRTLIASNTVIENTLTVSETPIISAETREVKTTTRDSYTGIRPLDPLVFSSFDLGPATDTISFIRSGEVFKYVREKAPVPSFFSANIGIAPEMALYRSGGVTTQEFNYWANAEIAYHFSRFSVHTGIGLGYTYDEGIYKIRYRSNDSVSFYKEVIGYYTDPVDPSKIIYITRNHAIYDSITHLADDRTRNRYTYLQIPLLLGYDIFETRKFSLSIEAGPAFSFLISQKKAEPLIDIPNGRLILLQDNSPSQQPVNWQLWVRLSIGYQFTKNWGLVIKPYYKYYLTSPAQSTESRNPSAQAIGLDVGIQYLFGRKSKKK